jgi:hypothetical protein
MPSFTRLMSRATIVQMILYSFLSIHLDRAEQELDISAVWDNEEYRTSFTLAADY